MKMQQEECSGHDASVLCTFLGWGVYIRNTLRHRGGAKRRAEPRTLGGVGAPTSVRSGREGDKPRPDYCLPNLTPWRLSVVSVRCSAFKARFDKVRYLL